MIQERIQIIIEWLEKNTAAIKDASARMKYLQRLAKSTGFDIETLQARMANLGISVAKTGRGFRVFQEGRRGALGFDAAVKKLGRRVAGFPAYMLSIMFLGMQLQRTFGGFLDNALSTYQMITENQTKSGKAMMKFQAAWEFFKFSIIEALEPLIIFFSKILSGVVDFISAHPGLSKIAAVLIIIGAVLGSILFWVGNIGLGIFGLKQMFTIMGSSALASIGGIGGALSTLGIVAALVIATILAAQTLWKIGNEQIKESIEALGNFWLLLTRGKVDEAVAEFGRFSANVTLIFAKLGVGLATIMITAFVVIENALRWMWNQTIGRLGAMKKEYLDLNTVLMEKLAPTMLAIKEAEEKLAEPLPFVQAAIDEIKATKIGPTLGEPTTLPTADLLEALEAARSATEVSINYSPTYNVEGMAEAEEFKRLLEEHDRQLMEEIERIKIPGV